MKRVRHKEFSQRLKEICNFTEIKLILTSLFILLTLSFTGIAVAHDSPHLGTLVHVHTIGEQMVEGDASSVVDKETLAKTIEGGNIIIDMSTVTYTGDNVSAGVISVANPNVPVFLSEDGIILSSGYSKAAELESNNAPKFSYPAGESGVDDGDSDLEILIPGFETQDASVLQFEFTPENPLICVHYIFASGEYNNFVGRDYDDIFAFFLRKKGDSAWENIALVPTSGDRVSVNSINCDPENNPQYFVNNDKWDFDPNATEDYFDCPEDTYNSYPTEYNGFTQILCAESCDIIPDETYEIKLAIADTGDDLIDSAVIIDKITDEPDILTIVTPDLTSQEVNTTYTASVEATGSGVVPYIWTDCSDCSCLEFSDDFPEDLKQQILAGNCPSIVSTGDKTAEFSWILPESGIGPYIDITFEVRTCYDVSDGAYGDYIYCEEEGEVAYATFRYTDPPVNSASSSGGGGGAGAGGGGCFIATAAFGSYLHPDVNLLKKFRDNHLLTNYIGTQFVKTYYKYSPPIADYIAERETLRTATRIALTPLVYSVKYPGAALMLFGFAVLPFAYRKVKKIK